MESSFNLVRNAVVLWPRSTGVVIVALSAGNALVEREQYGLSDAATLLAGTAWLLGLVGYKALMVFMLYPVLFRAPFSGSFIRVMFVAMGFFLGAGLIAATFLDISGKPYSYLFFPFVAFSYVFSSLLVGSFLRLNYMMHRNKRVPWRRLDEDSPAAPGPSA